MDLGKIVIKTKPLVSFILKSTFKTGVRMCAYASEFSQTMISQIGCSTNRLVNVGCNLQPTLLQVAITLLTLPKSKLL